MRSVPVFVWLLFAVGCRYWIAALAGAESGAGPASSHHIWTGIYFDIGSHCLYRYTAEGGHWSGDHFGCVYSGLGRRFFIWLDLIPHQKNFWYGILVQIAALVIMSFAVSIQMKAALSCGPRDALMVAIGKRLPRVSIGTISISVSLIVLLIGFLLGGSVGAGTVINLVLSGIILDFVFTLIHFEPRAVVHENLLQTCSEFIRAVRA